MRWDEFRHFGPRDARWDHHLLNPDSCPYEQDRAVYYAATHANTTLAEFFQHTRRIDRTFQSPWLVVFELNAQLALLDLDGDFATRAGASMAMHTGSRACARGWARDFYEAYPHLQGIYYPSSMNGGEPALALNERALAAGAIPAHPVFNRALADDALLDVLLHAAARLGFALG